MGLGRTDQLPDQVGGLDTVHVHREPAARYYLK